jgi:hypothetical protein
VRREGVVRKVQWDVRVDASADPVDTVEASGWFEARALAAEKLGVPVG